MLLHEYQHKSKWANMNQFKVGPNKPESKTSLDHENYSKYG